MINDVVGRKKKKKVLMDLIIDVIINELWCVPVMDVKLHMSSRVSCQAAASC